MPTPTQQLDERPDLVTAMVDRNHGVIAEALARASRLGAADYDRQVAASYTRLSWRDSFEVARGVARRWTRHQRLALFAAYEAATRACVFHARVPGPGPEEVETGPTSAEEFPAQGFETRVLLNFKTPTRLGRDLVDAVAALVHDAVEPLAAELEGGFDVQTWGEGVAATVDRGG